MGDDDLLSRLAEDALWAGGAAPAAARRAQEGATTAGLAPGADAFATPVSPVGAEDASGAASGADPTVEPAVDPAPHGPAQGQAFASLVAPGAPPQIGPAAVVTGGAAAERLEGTQTDDVLTGLGGADTLVGRKGDDMLFGGVGADRLRGMGGDDSLVGAGGADRLIGGGGVDTMRGGGGRDSILGGAGDDRLFGGGARDLLKGGGRHDFLNGGAGKDTLEGGAGDDKMNGGGRDDTLIGGAGDDRLTGGARADTFIFRNGDFDAGETDTITDFTTGLDRVDLTGLTGLGGFEDLVFTREGADLILAVGAGRIVFRGLADAAAPTADDLLTPGPDEAEGGGSGGEGTGGGETGGGETGGGETGGGETGGGETGGGETGGGETGGGETGGGETGGGETGGGETGGGETGGGETGGGETGGGETGPPQVLGGAGADTISGEAAAAEEVRGRGADDVIGSGPGADTLFGGAGADIFAILLEGGALDDALDTVDDFSFGLGDQVGVAEAVGDLTYEVLAEVVEAAPVGSDTVIRVKRGDMFEDALLLKGVSFTTAQLLAYGFAAPARREAVFDESPYGFMNTSNTTADPVATRDGRYVAYLDKQNVDDAAGDVAPAPFDDDAGFAPEDRSTMDVFIRNLDTGSVERVSGTAAGDVILNADGEPVTASSPAISENGRHVAFVTTETSASGVRDDGNVYVRDMLTGDAPVLVSVNARGGAAGGVATGRDFTSLSVGVLDISADGGRVAFVTTADLTGADQTDENGEGDVYLRDLEKGQTTLISAGVTGNAVGGAPSPYDFSSTYTGDLVALSEDGRYVAFVTDASLSLFDRDGLVDLYLRDTMTDATILISGAGGGAVTGFDMSADGARIAFAMEEDFGADDRNGVGDVYVADIDLVAFAVGAPRRVSEAEGGFALRGGDSYAPVLSPDGSRIAFLSEASDITPIDGDASFVDNSGRLVEVDLATGAVSVPPARFSTDTGTGDRSTVAYDLTDEGLVFRQNFGAGDTIVAGATAPGPAPADVPSNSADTVAVSEFVPFVRGEIETVFDRDTYLLTNGSRWNISVEGADSGAGTLANPIVQIRLGSPLGPVVASNDDGGVGLDAHVRFIGDPAETYYVSVGSNGFDGLGTGSYLLRVDRSFPSSDLQTPAFLQQDDPLDERIFSATDLDVFAFDSEPDETGLYLLRLDERDGFTNQLENGVMRVLDRDGVELASSDPGDTTLLFAAPEEGLAFVEVSAPTDADAGHYSIELDEFVFVPIFDPVLVA